MESAIKRSKALGATGYVLLAAVLVFAAGYALVRQRPPAFDHGKVYRIGYGNDAPYHFVGPDGSPMGLAVELVREAARRSGIKLEWVPGTGFNLDTVDMWVLATITPERLKLLHLTEP